MILTASEILAQRNEGRIFISDFNTANLGQNSYNLRLSDELVVYKEAVLDMRVNNPTEVHKIPESGFMLLPNILYLGRTVEITHTMYPFVPMLEGRSSIGRLGLQVHVTAGFGDVGFKGCWTLEMTTVHPLMIYPGVEIAQIYYHKVCGDDPGSYSGKYQHADRIQSSELHREFVGK